MKRIKVIVGHPVFKHRESSKTIAKQLLTEFNRSVFIDASKDFSKSKYAFENADPTTNTIVVHNISPKDLNYWLNRLSDTMLVVDKKYKAPFSLTYPFIVLVTSELVKLPQVEGVELNDVEFIEYRVNENGPVKTLGLKRDVPLDRVIKEAVV